jgi:archaellum component FlaC
MKKMKNKVDMTNIDNITTTRELLDWCDTNQKKMIKMLDAVFDNLDTSDPAVQDALKDASDILNDIEELEKEVEKILTNHYK